MPGILAAAASLAQLPLPLPDRDGARAAAHRELSRAIYAQHRPNLLQRAYEALLRWLGRLIGTLVSVTPGGTLGLVVFLLLMTGLVILVLRSLGPVRGSVASELDAGVHARTAAMERSHAEALAARGAWAEAIRARLRAVSRELEESAVLAPRPGRTAVELATEAGAARPGLAAQIRLAAIVFDEVWYGGRPATSAGYATVTAADVALTRAPQGAGR